MSNLLLLIIYLYCLTAILAVILTAAFLPSGTTPEQDARLLFLSVLWPILVIVFLLRWSFPGIKIPETTESCDRHACNHTRDSKH